MATTAIATQSQSPKLVKDTNLPVLIATNDTARQYIEPLLPKGVTIGEVAAKVRLALAKDTTGALQKCTVGSVILAVAKICGWGLEIGTTAHLVPFGAECTALRDYTGDIQLAIESGMVRRVAAHIVYANEPFRLVRGSVTSVDHHPIAVPSERGPMIGCYAMVYFGRGEFEVEYRTVEEVDEIRQKHSKQWKAGLVAPWYMRKTVARQALKLIPKSPRMRALLAVMDDEGQLAGVEQVDAVLADIVDPETGEVLEAPVQRGPRPLAAVPHDDPYASEPAPSRVPVAPGSVDDGPDVDRGELELGETRSAPRRRANAQID
jgi:recombinational DNA repair protein RecT